MHIKKEAAKKYPDVIFLLQWENKDARQSTTCELFLDDLPSNYCETKLLRENSYSHCFNSMIDFPVGKYWVSAKTQKSFTHPWKQTDYRLSQCISVNTTENNFLEREWGSPALRGN